MLLFIFFVLKLPFNSLSTVYVTITVLLVLIVLIDHQGVLHNMEYLATFTTME